MNTPKTVLTAVAFLLSIVAGAQPLHTSEVLFASAGEEKKASIVLTSANLLEINAPAGTAAHTVVVKIYDAKEKEIYFSVYEEYESFTKRISLSNLNTGDYMVEVSSGLAKTIQKVFVR